MIPDEFVIFVGLMLVIMFGFIVVIDKQLDDKIDELREEIESLKKKRRDKIDTTIIEAMTKKITEKKEDV